MKCLGRNLDDHCCYIASKVCPFLEENSQPGFRWSCGLRRELGSWDAVVESKRYKDVVEPHFAPRGLSCKDWPGPGQDCGNCGAKG